MLIKFKTPDYPRITMFGEVATKLLKMMGHSGTVPGALSAGDVPVALEKLREAVKAQAATEPPPPPDSELEPNAEPPVGIAARAFPLIELLETAAAAGKPVMWDQ